MDPLDLEVSKLCEVRQFQVALLSRSDSDSVVIVNDSRVELYGEQSEEPLDVLAIQEKFLLSVYEVKEGGFNQCLPSDNPVAMCFDHFGWCGRTVEQFDVLSKLNGFSSFMGDSVEI